MHTVATAFKGDPFNRKMCYMEGGLKMEGLIVFKLKI